MYRKCVSGRRRVVFSADCRTTLEGPPRERCGRWGPSFTPERQWANRQRLHFVISLALHIINVFQSEFTASCQRQAPKLGYIKQSSRAILKHLVQRHHVCTPADAWAAYTHALLQRSSRSDTGLDRYRQGFGTGPEGPRDIRVREEAH